MCVLKELLLVNFLLGGEPVIISLFQSWNSVCVCDSMCKCIDPEVIPVLYSAEVSMAYIHG